MFHLFSRHLLIILAIFAASGSVSGSLEGADLSAIETITEEVKLDSGPTASWKKAECHLRPVVHVLEHKDCIPMPVPSAACVGTCNSYVQVSSSKFWQVERSCSCCAELSEMEATFYLRCPKLVPQFRKVTARSPKECACRPCTAVDVASVKAQEYLELGRN